MSGTAPAVLFTRPEPPGGDTVATLAAAGLDAVHIALTRIAPPDSWAACDDAIAQADRYDGLLFTSARAVDAFFARCAALGRAAAQFPPAFAVGARTAEALAAHGVSAALVSGGGGDTLAAAIPGARDRRYLHPCAAESRPELADGLTSRGARVTEVAVYRTEPCDADTAEMLRRCVAEGRLRCAAFFAPSAVRRYCEILRPPPPLLYAAIGRTTAEALALGGCAPGIVPETQGETSLTAAIISALTHRIP